VLAQHEAEYYHPLLRRHQSAFLPTLAEVLKVRLQEGGPHLLTAAILSVTWTMFEHQHTGVLGKNRLVAAVIAT
jgi:hypothetical protein